MKKDSTDFICIYKAKKEKIKQSTIVKRIVSRRVVLAASTIPAAFFSAVILEVQSEIPESRPQTQEDIQERSTDKFQSDVHQSSLQEIFYYRIQ